VWNAKIQEYLGIDVPDDAQGVLQDVHWGSGLFGYFPTYALGNVVAAQLWERITRELPGLDSDVSNGSSVRCATGSVRIFIATGVNSSRASYSSEW
jgi:Zn-dependent M32 family carboxypeptidase